MAKRKIGVRKEVVLDNGIAIEVKNLSKSFRLPTERSWGLKQAIFNRLRGVKGYKDQRVLRNLSFKVNKGEFLGIVGRNGSGKSTLLKILSGIYYPESGEVTVNGTLVPFIELGVGFNPELTGRENVYLNGALLGFSKKEMDAMYEDIWKFAELEEFQDQKLKNYSSGMQVRLAFSIAIRAKGDILILDEVLAVGDAAFQQKCNDYFASLRGNQTVILVTHSMSNVRKFCDRAILIEGGKIVVEGEPEKVADEYMKLFQ
ncbi:ABC transporter ATP-binding protein [Candidatus Saccharibacteria bacterium]|nr:ABC transporter ATP-binding protein [Candidatus Saccharibacteria bacterium]